MSEYLKLHPFVKHVVADKIRGAVVGSTLGDSIGLYTEFLNKPMSKDAYSEGRFQLAGKPTPFLADSHRSKGSWTDDTDHALLIILSFLHHDGTTLSSLDFAKRLRNWIEQGLLCLERLPLGLGRTVGSVVMYKNYLDDPKASAFRNWANSAYTVAANGSLMRTYPLGLMCFDKSLEETFGIATDFSLVTHADLRCVVSCCIATAIIRGVLRGEVLKEEDLDPLIDQAATYVESLPPRSIPEAVIKQMSIQDPTRSIGPPPPLDRDELYTHTRANSYSDLRLDDMRKIGYVYKCLGSSILCLRLAMRRLQSARDLGNNALPTRSVFEDLISELVMEGGDADTNGAVAGALIGCLLGFNSLPPHWYEGLQDVDWLVTKTDALIQTLGVDECAVGYVGSADADTREDGGKGFLDLDQLKAREMAFMEMYMKKPVQKKSAYVSQTQVSGAGQGFIKKWKDMFISP